MVKKKRRKSQWWWHGIKLTLDNYWGDGLGLQIANLAVDRYSIYVLFFNVGFHIEWGFPLPR